LLYLVGKLVVAEANIELNQMHNVEIASKAVGNEQKGLLCAAVSTAAWSLTKRHPSRTIGSDR
jgi:hypothetical protein